MLKRIMLLTTLILSALLAGPAAADKDVAAIKKAEGRGHIEGKRWAVIVGVNDYDSANVNDLNYAVQDARAMAEALEAMDGLYSQVLLLTDDGTAERQPTRLNILKAVKTVTSLAGPDDMIVFFFSGHGFPDDAGNNYLASRDTDPTMLQDTAVRMQRLYEFFNISKARARVVLLDACHSGARRDKGDDDHMSHYLYNGEGSVAIASSQYEQSSFEWPEKGMGAFTYFLVQGLNGAADSEGVAGNGDGLVTSYELEQYVTNKVQEWAVSHYQEQIPSGKRNMSGDVVLGVTGHGQPAVITPQVSTGRSCPPGMVYIQPGSFTMGCSSGDEQCQDDEKPAKNVTISKGYCMDIYEVTNRDYAAFLNANGNVCMGNECVNSDSDWLRLEGSGRSWTVKSGWGNHPMTEVSWYGAKAYCESHGKRLPTEAQWEFAARAATTTPYYWGSEMNDAYAWHSGNAGGKTHPVGQKRANNYGLYDMAGNVWEWVADCYDGDWYSKMPLRDPVNTCTGSGYRVLRGGSWLSHAWDARVSVRYWYRPGGRHDRIGFRCAQDF